MARLAWLKRLVFSVVFALVAISAAKTHAQTVLLVTSQNGSLTSEESARRSSFQSWGYTVTTVWAGASQLEIDNAVAAAVVAYIPEDVVSGDLNTKLRLAPIGVINEENLLDDDLGFSAAVGSERSGTQIYLTQFNSTLTIVSSSQPLSQMNGTLAPGLTVMARTTNTGPVTVGTIEKGAALANTINGNSAAAGRRVRMPFGGNNFAWASLNSNGLAVVQEALNWARQSMEQLELHWRLDDGSGANVADASGNYRHGAFQTGTPQWTTGPRDGAIDFSGSNDIRSNAHYDPPARGTVAFWMKRDDALAGIERLLGTGEDWEVALLADGRLAFDLGIGGTASGFVTDITLVERDRWYHVVGVYDSVDDTYAIYLDGELHKTGSYGLVDQSANYLSVGSRTGLSTERYNGTIDDLRIYNYELDAEEVAELHGLIGHWKFDEATGTIAADSTAFGNNATLNGATWTTDCVGNVAVAFDGANDFAATDATFTPPAEGTIAFWFQSTAPANAHQRLWGVGGDFEMRQATDGTLFCDVTVEGHAAGFATNEPLVEAKWYHIVATYDTEDETYAIYLNGELHRSGTSSVDMTPQTAATLSFGTRTGSTEYWQGSMRDFRIYNRKILTPEILELSGVLAHYRLDELNGSVALDSSLAQLHGTYYGAPSLGARGPNSDELGTAIELDGTTQYVSSERSLLSNLTQFTLAGWVRLDSLTNNRSFFGQNDVVEFGLNQTSNRIHFWTSNGGFVNVDGELNTGRWTHIAAVGDGTSLYVYVNGELVGVGGTSIGGGTYGSSGYAFKIGEGIYNSSGDYLDGRVDDVRIFSRALCASEIQELADGYQVNGIRIIRWTEVQ